MILVDERELSGIIYGQTDAAIAETATFFWSLKHSNHRALLKITELAKLDVTVFRSQQLLQIIDAHPQFELHVGSWNDEQCVAFVTRPYPVDLTIGGAFQSKNDETAFVNALEQRTSSFGTLRIDYEDSNQLPFRVNHLQRLLQCNVFEQLNLSEIPKEVALLPFSAKVNALGYTISSTRIQPQNCPSLPLLAKDLHLTLLCDFCPRWRSLFLALLNRLAELRHLEKLTLSLRYEFDEMSDEEEDANNDLPSRIAAALVGVIRGNPRLTHFQFEGAYSIGNWYPQLQEIFRAMEDHPGIRTVVLGEFPWTLPFDFYRGSDNGSLPSFVNPWLEQLLTRNRAIQVLDTEGGCISQNRAIQKLFHWNRFFYGSAALMQDRPRLVTTVLTNVPQFQYTALLLSDHTDVLCEFLNNHDLAEAAIKKRKAPPRRNMAKKTARTRNSE